MEIALGVCVAPKLVDVGETGFLMGSSSLSLLYLANAVRGYILLFGLRLEFVGDR